MSLDPTTELQERVARFDDTIAKFKRAQEQIVARRNGAADHIMVELDDRLVVNRRTIEALERSRVLAIEDLQRQQRQRDGDFSPRIVVVDDNPEGRFFLSRAVRGVFPRADIVGCENSEAALAELRAGNAAGFVVHRANDADGLPMVEFLRAASATIPIVYMSGIDRAEAAFTAGATTFLLFDQAASLGPILRNILRR
ncbi:MAG: response regulator [Opitutaceae bacterium]|nr:response regulator [Opitutaceae bacterium]